jgi:hypothetical protein
MTQGQAAPLAPFDVSSRRQTLRPLKLAKLVTPYITAFAVVIAILAAITMVLI